MQNKLMNGVNGMSDFEKRLDELTYNSRTGGGYKLFSEIELKQTFGNWQPSKPLIEVDQFVADWFELMRSDLTLNIRDYEFYLIQRTVTKDDFYYWYIDAKNNPIETIIRMKLEGYIVVSG